MVDLTKIRAERAARGLTVWAFFKADCVGVREGRASEGFGESTFASEESRDDFIRRVRNNGGTTEIA